MCLNYLRFIFFSAVLVISGCGGRLDFRNAEISNGLIFDGSDNKPFTGDLTGIPAKSINFPNPDEILNLAQSLNGDMSWGPPLFSNNESMLAFCDVEVKDGYLHGDAECVISSTGVKFSDMSYKRSKPVGDLVVYSVDNPGSEFARLEFNDSGLLDGVVEIFNPSNGKLVATLEMSDGKRNGKFTTYSRDGERLTGVSNFLNGAKTGLHIRYAQDGKTKLHELTYLDGKITGPATIRDASGVVLFDGEFIDGVDVEVDSRVNEVVERLASRFPELDREPAFHIIKSRIQCIDKQLFYPTPMRDTKYCREANPDLIEKTDSEIFYENPYAVRSSMDDGYSEGVHVSYADSESSGNSAVRQIVEPSFDYGPSFSCEKASALVEKIICASRELSVMDKSLQGAYREATACTKDRDGLIASQRSWVRSRNQCSDDACISNQYESRIGYLESACQ